jgi:3-phenylpropionate/trans-cinnamate dioxygenase ferredoxin reductase subunit
LQAGGTGICVPIALSALSSTRYKGQMISSIIIIGGGQAGAQAIDTLRREGFSGRLVLIGNEPELPYQRPPLSKKYLSGEMAAERLVFRHRSFYDEHGIELKLGQAAVRLDPAARQVALADVAPIREGFKPQARIVVIGGGYIGLETAATCRKMGCEVTVLEMADRIMNRVVAPAVSQYFAGEHLLHGVNIVCDTRVVCLEGTGRVERVVCADGSTHAADLVVVGVGAVATTELASAAGLACDNGIVVDEYCRTSDAAIFAAGDCTNHPSLRFGRRVRLESVDNAFEQAKTAALNILDRPHVHDRVPWFWSDQFDNKLLIVGLSQDYDRQVLRGSPESRSFSVCYLKGQELLAVEAINHSKDYMAARKLIAERTPLQLDKLADSGLGLKDAI